MSCDHNQCQANINMQMCNLIIKIFILKSLVYQVNILGETG